MKTTFKSEEIAKFMHEILSEYESLILVMEELNKKTLFDDSLNSEKLNHIIQCTSSISISEEKRKMIIMLNEFFQIKN